MTLVNALLLILSIALAAPLLFVAAECALSLAPRRRRDESVEKVEGRTAVLIPAHDEERVIEETLRTILPQLREGDRCLVVADNCSDATAERARAAGAQVAERVDLERRGKGYALQFGVEHLADDPPASVIVVDADCRVSEGSVRSLHGQAVREGRPAQSVNLMTGPGDMSPRIAVGALAFLVKNLARPLGLDRLGLPCLLTGTGMAFPWGLARDADFAGSDNVEDMRLGLDLARRGAPARLCLDAEVLSDFPESKEAGATQRTRWEHGHLRTLLTLAPGLMIDAVRRGSIGLLALALELSVPPLALLVMATCGVLALLLLAAVIGASTAPAIVLGAGLATLGLMIVLAWARHGRALVPARALVGVPLYVIAKIPLYLAFMKKPERAWVRTERGGAKKETAR